MRPSRLTPTGSTTGTPRAIGAQPSSVSASSRRAPHFTWSRRHSRAPRPSRRARRPVPPSTGRRSVAPVRSPGPWPCSRRMASRSSRARPRRRDVAAHANGSEGDVIRPSASTPAPPSASWRWRTPPARSPPAETPPTTRVPRAPPPPRARSRQTFLGKQYRRQRRRRQ